MASVTVKETVEEIRRCNPGIRIWYSEDKKQIMFEKNFDASKLELPDTIKIDTDKMTIEGTEITILEEVEKKDGFTEISKPKFNEEIDDFLKSKLGYIVASARREAAEDEKVDKPEGKILKKDEELYDLLMQLRTIFGSESLAKKDSRASKIFDLHCKIGTDETNLRRVEFIISESDIKTLIKLEPLIKKYLGKNFVLPNEIYQIMNGNTLPETDKEAPSPKTLFETEEDYEKRLEAHYGSKKNVEGHDEVREAYPHERVDYSSNPENYVSQEYIEKNNYPSEYYNNYFKNHFNKTKTGEPEPAGKGEKPEREQISDLDLDAKASLKGKIKRFGANIKNNININTVLKAVAIAGVVGVTIAAGPHVIAALGTIFGKALVLNGASPFAAGVLTGSQIKAIISALIAAGVLTYFIKHKRKKKGEQPDAPEGPKPEDEIKVLSPDESAEKLNAALAEKQKTDSEIKVHEVEIEVLKRKIDGTYSDEFATDLLMSAEETLTKEQIAELITLFNGFDKLNKEQLEQKLKEHTETLKALLVAQKQQLQGIQDILNSVKDKGGIVVGGLSHA